MPVQASSRYDDAVNVPVRPSLIVSQVAENGSTREDSAGYDLSNKLTDFGIRATMDDAMQSAQLTLAMGKGPTSISPLVSTTPRLGSRAVIMPHNAIVLNIEGMDSLFTGRIDRVSVQGESVILNCRDSSAYIQEATIRETALYGAGGGTAAETVMGQILTDHGFSAFSLGTAVSPGFQIYPYPVGEVGTLDALRTIAQQIGWDVRWFPGHLTPATLRFYDPGRLRSAADAVLDKRRYETVEAVEWGDEDVRNDWDVYYQDPATGLPRGPIHREHGTSIGLYARRKARIYLQRAENIRDDAQAGTFADVALADSKDPFVSHRIRMSFYPNVTLNDLHTYEANGKEYDQDLFLAVVAYTHSWSSKPNTAPVTTIGARGRPLAAYREYRTSIPPKTIVTTAAPTTEYAPEGTLILVTDSILPP